MNYFVIFFIFLGFVGTVFIIPNSMASEPKIINEDMIMGNVHPDSCTRWQQWEHGFCIDGTDYPAHLDAANFLKIVSHLLELLESLSYLL